MSLLAQSQSMIGLIQQQSGHIIVAAYDVGTEKSSSFIKVT